MKQINKKSQQMISEVYKMLNSIPVTGQQSIAIMGTAMGYLQEIAKQVDESDDVEVKNEETAPEKIDNK